MSLPINLILTDDTSTFETLSNECPLGVLKLQNGSGDYMQLTVGTSYTAENRDTVTIDTRTQTLAPQGSIFIAVSDNVTTVSGTASFSATQGGPFINPISFDQASFPGFWPLQPTYRQLPLTFDAQGSASLTNPSQQYVYLSDGDVLEFPITSAYSSQSYCIAQALDSTGTVVATFDFYANADGTTASWSDIPTTTTQLQIWGPNVPSSGTAQVECTVVNMEGSTVTVNVDDTSTSKVVTPDTNDCVTIEVTSQNGTDLWCVPSTGANVAYTNNPVRPNLSVTIYTGSGSAPAGSWTMPYGWAWLLDFEVVGYPDPKIIVKQPPSDIKARRS